MNNEMKQSGFSLTEVLMAVGVFAVGMVMVAGIFPVAIHFTNETIECTTAAVVADEAFAKINLYGLYDPNLVSNSHFNFENAAIARYAPFNLSPVRHCYYPSVNLQFFQVSQLYSWSAICRLVDAPSRTVQVTVFVCKKIGAASAYRDNPFTNLPIIYPKAVQVGVLQPGSFPADELSINNVIGYEKTFINDGSTIVDDKTGQIYRVLERYKSPNDTIIKLDRPWVLPVSPTPVWVIPPTVNGGVYPSIAVYQKTMSF